MLSNIVIVHSLLLMYNIPLYICLCILLLADSYCFLLVYHKLVLLRNLLCMHSDVCVYISISISVSIFVYIYIGLPKWHSGKESTCQFRRCKRHDFEPWVRKIPWSQKWQPTPVSLPGKSHGQRSLAGYSPWDCRVRHNWAQTCVYTHTHTHVCMYTGS